MPAVGPSLFAFLRSPVPERERMPSRRSALASVATPAAASHGHLLVVRGGTVDDCGAAYRHASGGDRKLSRYAVVTIDPRTGMVLDQITTDKATEASQRCAAAAGRGQRVYLDFRAPTSGPRLVPQLKGVSDALDGGELIAKLVRHKLPSHRATLQTLFDTTDAAVRDERVDPDRFRRGGGQALRLRVARHGVRRGWLLRAETVRAPRPRHGAGVGRV